MSKALKIRRELNGGTVAAYVLGSFALLVFMVAVIGLSFVAAAFAAKGGAAL